MALFFVNTGQIGLEVARQRDGRGVVGLLLDEGPADLFGFGFQDRERGRGLRDVLPVEDLPWFRLRFRGRHAQPGGSGMTEKIQQTRDESG